MTSYQLAMQLLNMPDTILYIPKINSFQEIELLGGAFETHNQGSGSKCDSITLRSVSGTEIAALPLPSRGHYSKADDNNQKLLKRFSKMGNEELFKKLKSNKLPDDQRRTAFLAACLRFQTTSPLIRDVNTSYSSERLLEAIKQLEFQLRMKKLLNEIATVRNAEYRSLDLDTTISK